jgi:hypothetical protein
VSVVEYNFGVDQGSDFTQTITFANEDASGDPALMTYVSFVGCGVRMSFRSALSRSSSLVLALSVGSGMTLTESTITGGPAPTFVNGFSWTVTKAQSLALFPDGATLYYDAFVDTGGLSALYMQGTCTVGTTVT